MYIPTCRYPFRPNHLLLTLDIHTFLPNIIFCFIVKKNRQSWSTILTYNQYNILADDHGIFFVRSYFHFYSKLVYADFF